MPLPLIIKIDARKAEKAKKTEKVEELESKKRERAMRFNTGAVGSVPPLSAEAIAAEEEK